MGTLLQFSPDAQLSVQQQIIHKHTHAHTFTHTYAVLLSSLHPSAANVQGEEDEGCRSKRWKGYQFIMELLLRVMKKT